MSVYRVLDKLESYVHEGTWLPAGYRVLSEERLLEFVEKIRSTLPKEVGRAQIIAKDQDRVMRAAQEKADELIDDHEILQRARTTAEVVLREAEERARKIREGADTYATQVLAEMEARLAAAIGSVQKGRAALANTPKPVAAPQQQPLADAAAKSKRAAFDLQAPQETSELESVDVVKA
jgi:vacuolar-type H+-ATPase subunit H